METHVNEAYMSWLQEKGRLSEEPPNRSILFSNFPEQVFICVYVCYVYLS